MEKIVLKFGGTSLRDEKSRAALLNHVKKYKNNGYQIIVVVSAMGRAGEPYATDSLISLLANISEAMDPKKKDLIMSCGEIISSAVIAHLFDVNGIPAEALTGFQAGIYTNKTFNDSDILHIDTSKITRCLDDGKVVVVAGFQGITEDMEITTLGRGGSDITAVALGGYLNAKIVDIFTDVPGVAVIDPHIISYTSYQKKISYSNMYKLACNGTKVIHPRAVSTAEKFNIPICVRSTFCENSGTLIFNYENQNESIIGISIDKDYTYSKIEKTQENNITFPNNTSILHKDKEDFISLYYSNNNFIKNIEESMATIYKYPVTKIMMLYNSRLRDTIKTDLENSFSEVKLSPLDIFWFDDNVTLFVHNNDISVFAEVLYKIYNGYSSHLSNI
ncbi:aspartate kinase [Proteiniborus sp. DW1]|uniref:amino acid kinase family protein n=1 Tax=Proteiniborus sp. DW1 TaxID=1889883 RepID=UPI00092E1ADA|nr:hypothetical protein [Proteiniborus sp. DW1]SCG84298.1 aspartate kinase [Proteiniborus sp. DW1]